VTTANTENGGQPAMTKHSSRLRASRSGPAEVVDSVIARYAQASEAPSHAASDDGRGFAIPRPRSPYLTVETVAERLHVSRRVVHEWTRTLAIPHRRLPGTRRCLFVEAELEAWETGAELEVVEGPRGGRVVRPKEGR
jgi:excisionase family DNA binding protein